MPALKRSMDSPSIAPLLGNAMKSSDEAAGVAKGIDETALNRKVVNMGPFKILSETMQYRNVDKVAKKADIEFHNIKVKIIRDPNLIGSGYCGWTSPDGKIIHLYPDAFSDTERLVKTLGHERIHSYQVKTFGAPDSQTIFKYESGAYDSEISWWGYYNKNNR